MTFLSRPLLKISDVTTSLGVSKSTIYKWVNEGVFPKPIVLNGDKETGVNSATRWYVEDIEEWLKSRTRSNG
jgi:prophage regulatory protein